MNYSQAAGKDRTCSAFSGGAVLDCSQAAGNDGPCPGFQVEFAAVDCTQETGVCGANDVRGYPTLKYYNYFKTSRPYDGGRTVRGC